MQNGTTLPKRTLWARIRLGFGLQSTAEKVGRAISPENTEAPEGLSIVLRTTGTEIIVDMECDRGLDSLRNTIEDTLGAIDMAIRIKREIESRPHSKENMR